MEKTSPPNPIDYYLEAREWLIRSPFYQELLWQEAAAHEPITECRFLREHAWVVLNSGFRESTVRKRFDYISLCFCDWESAGSIAQAGLACVNSAMAVFRNERKLGAILRTAQIVNEKGFDRVLSSLERDPAGTLLALPHIGSVTAQHLAKNLGFNVVKPDRHLLKLSADFGYSDPIDLCGFVSAETGDEASVVDLVLWRFQQQIGESRGKV